LKQQHPAIPWKQISGFRNILVHNYLGEIDSQTVLTVVQQYLTPLEKTVQAMLESSAGET